MEPHWFSFTDVPYEKMWADDKHWMPQVFAGKKVKGTVWFKKDDKTIDKMEWQEVDGF
jgi:hypothetical protein